MSVKRKYFPAKFARVAHIDVAQSQDGSVIDAVSGSDIVDLSYFFFQNGSVIVDLCAFVAEKKER